jgi:hypothetical protein
VIARKFCVLALGILVIGYSSSVTAEVPEIGQKAPEFRLSPSAGHALKLSEFTAKGTLALVADLRETTRLTRLFNLADTVTNSAAAILSMRAGPTGSWPSLRQFGACGKHRLIAPPHRIGVKRIRDEKTA